MHETLYPTRRVRVSLVREGPRGDRPYCSKPEAAARFLELILGDLPGEAMVVLLLDTRRRLTGWDVPYRGTLNRMACEPRGVIVPALLANASSIVVAHNHPSGDTSPSAEDLAFTRRLSSACDVVGLALDDHIILGEGGAWLSLRERGGW